jgi:hypothetical protein
VTTANEYTLVEKSILDRLQAHGYRYIHPSEHPVLRPRENEVLFKPLLVAALVRINGIPADAAEAIFNDLAGLSDNQRWLEVLRGHYSRKIPGEETHRTIRVVDFDHPANNDFACTNQLRVQGEVVRKPDVVVYVNGIPLVVIEAKSPLSPSQNAFDAIDQIRSAEREVPRLFHSNLFNVATNDLTFMYGATGAPREHWARWRDPWPRKAEEFTDETEKGLYALLEPARLLDILAHFVVFETREGKTVKKLCRYQQLRAVNKMVQRVVENQHQRGARLAHPGQRQEPDHGVRRAEAEVPPGRGVRAARQPEPARHHRPHRPAQPDRRHVRGVRAAEPHRRRVHRAASAGGERQRLGADDHLHHLQVPLGRPAASLRRAEAPAGRPARPGHPRLRELDPDGGRGPPHAGEGPRAPTCGPSSRTPCALGSPAPR